MVSTQNMDGLLPSPWQSLHAFLEETAPVETDVRAYVVVVLCDSMGVTPCREWPTWSREGDGIELPWVLLLCPHVRLLARVRTIQNIPYVAAGGRLGRRRGMGPSLPSQHGRLRAAIPRLSSGCLGCPDPLGGGLGYFLDREEIARAPGGPLLGLPNSYYPAGQLLSPYLIGRIIHGLNCSIMMLI